MTTMTDADISNSLYLNPTLKKSSDKNAEQKAGNFRKSRRLASVLVMAVFLAAATARPARAWSNGGYSTDPQNPKYGTHDWIAQHALDWLPPNEKQYITDNLVTYLYGTELPDNSQAPDGIGDTVKHHVYYWSNGSLQDDAAAKRASDVFQEALTYLNAKDYVDAAKTAGIMTHYIADVAVFAHVMGAGTDWGAETGNNHSNYESYVEGGTSNYTDTFNRYLLFSGILTLISAYNATLNLARDTTFDHGQTYTCTWMNNNYNISNPVYWDRAGDSLNLAVNAVTHVLHTLYEDSNPPPTSTPSPAATPSSTPTPTSVIPEFPPAATATFMLFLLVATGVIVHAKKSHVTRQTETCDFACELT